MRRSILATLLAALAQVVVVVAPASAHSSADTPPALLTEDNAGVFIWHNGDGWHLRVVDRVDDNEHVYAGVITTDGSFTDINSVKNESPDEFGERGDQRLKYHFTLFNASDGLDWRVEDGSYLSFTLYRDGDLMPTRYIFVGESGEHHPSDNGFTYSE